MNEQEARAEAARRGLRIERRGKAWRLHGRGVDLICADLAHLNPVDFSPPDYRPMIERERMREA